VRLWCVRLWCGVTFPPLFEKELRRTSTAPLNLSLELSLEPMFLLSHICFINKAWAPR
jgi:hypothetical protein